MRDGPEAPDHDRLEGRPPRCADDEDEEEVVVRIPADVPEADALDQARAPAVPLPAQPPHLPDDPEVPEADALEQTEPATLYEDEDDERPGPGGSRDFE